MQSDESKDSLTIRGCKLVEAALSGNAYLLKEMKQAKSAGRQTQPDNMDGATTEDIPEQFANVYQQLSWTATSASLQSWSEALINAPEELFEKLAELFRAYIIHNDFSADILACAFVRLLKGALKDDTKSDNYRAIAISSLILKVFDNMIIILFGTALSKVWLQFGFMPKSGTTQCSWFVLEVVSYFKQINTSVKSVVLDCSKPFDKCLFSVLLAKFLTVVYHLYLYVACSASMRSKGVG